ncbi:hypothetical protein FQN55_008761 [Onygenales sp. PD_40]|nr:hypothetical protein FQN55_008761 [Onygenales sp. PD_40]KAK2779511.1 hypothetical protein FQN53_001334 [Emmonsiellopsis sp. PD_33]KAK2794723.1 hypothetical protein FQN52_007493 [Onygenales sp. PD_12]KAK2807139.1 hypothetical protein FQN51_004753 [Onygenales sp. PD_10]
MQALQAAAGLSVPDLSTPPPGLPTYKLEVTAYPEAKAALSNGLLRLRTDHTSGAKELATRAIVSLVRIAEIIGARLIDETEADKTREVGGKLRGSPHSPVETWWESCRKAGWILTKYGRPSMNAAITSAIVKALDRRRLGLPELKEGEYGVLGPKREVDEETGGGDGAEQIRLGIDRMHEYLTQRYEGEQQASIAAGLRDFLWEKSRSEVDIWEEKIRVVKVLTLSSSSTIRSALIAVLEAENRDNPNTGLNIQLNIMESRPLCEGVGTARDLVQAAQAIGATDRLRIRIASDASVGILARDVDVVLLGADRISEEGDVSNKTGSLAAAVCSKVVSDRVSVAVISDLEKIARPGAMSQHKDEENDAQELERIWGGQPEGTMGTISTQLWQTVVECKNVYFEWVPAKYIDRYICETGILDGDGIKEQSQLVLQAEKQLFGCFGG